MLHVRDLAACAPDGQEFRDARPAVIAVVGDDAATLTAAFLLQSCLQSLATAPVRRVVLPVHYVTSVAPAAHLFFVDKTARDLPAGMLGCHLYPVNRVNADYAVDSVVSSTSWRASATTIKTLEIESERVGEVTGAQLMRALWLMLLLQSSDHSMKLIRSDVADGATGRGAGAGAAAAQGAGESKA